MISSRYDLEHAFRAVFRSHIRTTLVAVVTLAIGLGIGTTIFTIADAIVFRQMPFGNQDRVVTIWATAPEKGIEHFEVNWSDLERFQNETEAFESFGAFSAANFPVVFTHDGEPSELPTNLVSAALFEMLETRPARGRLFGPEDQLPDAPGVVLISHDLWQTKFGGSEDVIGQTFVAQGESVEIVGVLPANLNLPRDADVILPLEVALPEPAMREYRTLGGIGLLREGVTLEQAQEQVSIVARRIEQEKAETHDGVGATLQPLRDEILGPLDEVLRMMVAMGILLIVISWTNVAGALLTQSVARRQEFAVRLGMGASGARIATQLFFELVFIGIVAFGAGWLLFRAALSMILAVAPADLPRLGEIAISPRSLLFLGVSALAGVLVLTLINSLRLGRIPIARALVEGGTRTTIAGTTRRALDLLVVTQIALTLVLLVAAAVFAASFRELTRIDPGFDRGHVITAHLPFGYTFGDDGDVRREFFRQFLQRVEEIPGVETAGTVLMRPLEIEQGWDLQFTLDGQDQTGHESNPMGNLLTVTPRYFEAMGLEMVAGRAFNADDRPDTPKVAIISRSLASLAGGEREAVGKRLKRGGPASEDPWIEIVGVIEDARYRGLTIPKPDIYVPYTQTNWSPNYLAVRSSGDPATIIPSVRRILSEMKPDIPLASVRTTDDLIDRHLAQPRLNAFVSIAFAVAALFVSIVGLYSALSYGVSRRSSELGIRLTLGATGGDVVRMVMRESLMICLAGLALGTLAVVMIVTLAQASFADLTRVGPMIVGVSACGVLIVSLVASLRPAWRAMRINPVDAVRAE